MEVKLLDITDYDKAKALFCESFNKEVKDISIPLLGELFGLYLSNRLIGICQIDYINNIFENKRQAVINNFCIKNEYRNKGYGNYLLNECARYLEEKNVNEIIVRSNRNRFYAHKLYKKNNFEEIDTVLLVKNLKEKNLL